MNPLVTIAVSCYNSENFIENTILSIINQTYKNIEIIIIDDASTDNTKKIINTYYKKDKRIRLIELKQNKGLSYTRNLALKKSTAEYILFMDSDDILNHNLLSEAVKIAVMNDSDLVIWDYEIFYNELNTKIKNKSILFNLTNIDKKELLELPSFIWLKLIRVKKAKDINLEFPDKLTKQDIPIHWKIILEIDKISILPKKLILYRQHKNSISYRNDKTFLDVIKVMNITQKYLQETREFSTYFEIFKKQKLNLYFNILNTIKPYYRNDFLNKVKESLTKNEMYCKINKLKSLRKIIFFYAVYKNFFIFKIINSMILSLKDLKRKICI